MLGQQTQLGSTTIGTSFGDIIINNVASVADGVISGFASFVHDPRSLKETISVFAKSAIPKKFADAVMLRRIETQKLDDIWSFPLNLAVSNTCPLPWILIEATTRSGQSSLQPEFNIMRTVDFVGRNYLYIRLPAVNTTNVMDQTVRTTSTVGPMEDPDHVYLGAWYRDLVPRLIKSVSFYPRSNSHKLFEYSGYDIFVHNILFGNAHKEMNDLMAGEDKFELQYDPYYCDGSAMGLSSFRGIDAFRNYDSAAAEGNANITTYTLSTSDIRWGGDSIIDYFQLDTQMQGYQFREFYRKGVWYETPVARNYHARHSIHSRRLFHQAKDIAIPLDILPFGYSVASSLPSAALSGECGFIQVTFFEDWLDRSFYLTRVSDIPSLHPLVNHIHYAANDTTPDGTTLTGTDPRIGWVNERSLGRFGDPMFVKDKSNTDAEETAERKFAWTQSGNVVGAGDGENLREGIIPTKLTTSTDGETFTSTPLSVYNQTGRNTKIPAGTRDKSENVYNSFVTGTQLTRRGVWNDVQNRSTVNDPRAISSSSRLIDVSSNLLVKMSSVDITYATQLKNQLGIKLLQVGYQSLPCVRELLSKLPNIYITTEWNDLRSSINTSSFEINNDLYIQAVVLWFMPYDSDIPQTRVYAPHMIDHELPIIAGIRLQNEQAQGNMTVSSKIMNEINPAQMNLNPLMENMYLISFSPSLSANVFPHAYYDSNISGYLKMEILPGEEGTSIDTCVNLTKGEYYVISIGVNGVASVNLNLFRLVF